MINIKLNKATIEDFESIIAFYDDVTDRIVDMAKYARWQKGKHPNIEDIRAYIEEGSMYLYQKDGAILGAMAITMYPFSLSITDYLYRSKNENEESTCRY